MSNPNSTYIQSIHCPGGCGGEAPAEPLRPQARQEPRTPVVLQTNLFAWIRPHRNGAIDGWRV